MNCVSVSSFSFLWLLLCLFMPSHCAENDIHCLKSIKHSIDPLNHLSNWDFNSNTEGFFCKFTGVDCWDTNEHRVSSLFLSYMGLKGPFPHGLEHCSSLKTLDLSHNELSGEIQKGICNLSWLTTLKLENNKLSGEIPQELGLLPVIRVFNVANNMLSGAVPMFARGSDVSLSYSNNSGLCGGILGPCEDKSGDRSFWYSFGIAYVCSATSVIVSFMYFCQPWTELKKGRRNGTSACKRKKQNYQNGSTNVAELLPLALEEKGSKEISTLLERLISRMKFGELCEATNYFSTDTVIGLGSTGMMYKANLPNNCLLAVKRLYDSDQYKTEFLLETMISGRHKHRNIVPLLGFCLVKRERILVYKYMSNGKLRDWLHRPMMLEWPVRIHIALGLARGLSWLHKKCKIVHVNLTSECVLLNKDFEPKISNFGKARFIDQTIEDHLRKKLFMINALGVKGSIEEDVYSFGIILFELITGKRLSPTITDSSDIDDSLMRFISANLSSGPSDFYNAIDNCLVGKGFDDKILCLIEVACDCVNPSLEKRPSMDDTYKKIRALWEGYGLKSDSGKRKLSMVCPVQITCTHEIECIL